MNKGIITASLALGLLTSVGGAAHAQQSAENPIVMKLASTGGIGSVEAALGEEIKQAVEFLSLGGIKVEFYPASQLGSAMEQLNGVMAGDVQAMYEEVTIFEEALPSLKVFGMPYVVTDPLVVRKVINGPIGKKFSEDMIERSGMRILGIAIKEPRNLTTEKPIHSLGDIKGLKIRVMNVPSSVDLWTALGANPTPMAFSEVYTSLATGVIAAQENPVDVIADNKLYEVQKYVTETAHIQANSMVVVNNQFFTSLPPDLQKALEDGVRIATDFNTQIHMARGQATRDFLRRKGMTIENIDLAPFVNASTGVYKSYVGKYFSQDLYDSIHNMK
jgi:tripartite ATP-independent transporter DctP family solute receptor